jgi:hypothetical protein
MRTPPACRSSHILEPSSASPSTKRTLTWHLSTSYVNPRLA